MPTAPSDPSGQAPDPEVPVVEVGPAADAAADASADASTHASADVSMDPSTGQAHATASAGPVPQDADEAPRTRARRVRAATLDAVCAKAVDLARDAAAEVAEPGTVGDHLGARAVGDRLVEHAFACTAKGYRGWRWVVVVARAPRARVATVCEASLVAGEESVLAPQWLPWSQRLRPGDVGPGDVLPRVDPDPRLEHGFEATGDEDVDRVALWELGLGRHRVLSREGREDAAGRWYAGDTGPQSETGRSATAPCSSCGFLTPLDGALRRAFGVCSNEWSPADGRVVALDFGCGAHSETDVDAGPEPLAEPVLDELGYDTVVR
ncbi:DUF3027 domain-containing protein [Thalassiella azotivora]